MKTHDLIGTRRRRDRESGQAMVEFAIILFPLLILVAGIIQFGIGLNFWLDQQRIANQGARWAVVNAWPGCARTAAAGSCTGANALDAYLTQQALSQGLRNSVVVSICYPDDGDALTTIGRVGTPVRVRLQTPFTFVPIVGIGTITLRADATMRLEQTTDPTVPAPANGHLSGVGACP